MHFRSQNMLLGASVPYKRLMLWPVSDYRGGRRYSFDRHLKNLGIGWPPGLLGSAIIVDVSCVICQFASFMDATAFGDEDTTSERHTDYTQRSTPDYTQRSTPSLAAETDLHNVNSTTTSSGGSSGNGYGYDNEEVFLWLPLVFVILFALIIIILIVASRFSFNCCLRSSSHRRSSIGETWELVPVFRFIHVWVTQ